MRLFPLLLVCFAWPAVAGIKCDVDLNYGLIVNRQQIRVIDESHTLYQINGEEQLIVGGNWINITPEQTEQLSMLSSGLHYVVPKMTLLATEGVQLAVETVEQVYTGLVGRDHKSYEKLQDALMRVHIKVKEKFGRSYDNYFMGPGNLENVDTLVDAELEVELEEAIDTSLGGILSAISGLAKGDAETEQRIENLSQRLETMGEEIERQVGPKADNLRQKAKWFCHKMTKLDEVEETLRASIPELQPYNVIISGYPQYQSKPH